MNEALKDAAVGVDRVMSQNKDEPEDEVSEDEVSEDEVSEDEVSEELTDIDQKIMHGLPQRIRNMEGHIGGLMSKIDILTAQNQALIENASTVTTEKVTTDAKTEALEPKTTGTKQVELFNKEAIDTLVDEFEDFAPVKDELIALRGELANTSPPMDREAMKDEILSEIGSRLAFSQAEAREIGKLDREFPGWEETAGTDEFKEWILDDSGPSIQEYAQMKAYEEAAPYVANNIVTEWRNKFPQWWAEKGSFLFSQNATDSARLLGGFNESRRENTSKLEARKQKRLARATTPLGLPGELARGISDEEAMKRGFNRIMRQYK